MRRLLIVEDDPNTLSGLLELLGDEGYEVQGVMQGNEALEVVSTKPVDMVLCDYNLPDINGLQVCRALKRLRPEMVLFMSTAFDDSKIFESAMECGIKKVFTKPVMLDDLLENLFIYSNRFNINKRNTYSFRVQELPE